jgi:hypothetical protein
LTTEFGVLLGADPAESLKIVSQISETNCTVENFVFNIILHHDSQSLAKTVSLNNCTDDGIVARKDALRAAVEAAFDDNNDATDSDDISVTLVGSSSLVLAFHYYWTLVEISVPPEYTENVYGIQNSTAKKDSLQYAVGLTELEANLALSGSAYVSAFILDSIGAEASISADVSGYVWFSAGASFKLVELDVWASSLRSILTPTDEFYDPDFARASLSMDGRFHALVELKRPLQLDAPGSVVALTLTWK